MVSRADKTSSPPASLTGERRVHVASLATALSGAALELSAQQVRHVVRVRRLGVGARVEAMDDEGRTAAGVLESTEGAWRVRLAENPRVTTPTLSALTIYAAVPKGSRADWMVEKLSELGVSALVPLVTARSVVSPGPGKLERFARLARESAKQSRRTGVMRIDPLTPLDEALGAFSASKEHGAVLTTERPGRSLAELEVNRLFIGPEGGWTEQELDAMTAAAGLIAAKLTQSVLRVETAAICAAGVLLVRRAPC